MRKHGRTAAGAQRWRCTDCAATYSFRREDQTQQATFTAFIDYVFGKRAQSEIDGTATGRSARRRFAWCWNVPTPPLAATGEIYDQLFIDGIYLAYNWALLTAPRRPTPQADHPQETEEKPRADRTRPLRHPHSRRGRPLDPKRVGRTLRLSSDTPSKTPRFGRHPARPGSSLSRLITRKSRSTLTSGTPTFHSAETVGFEPTEGVNPHILSRDAHSSRLCDVS